MSGIDFEQDLNGEQLAAVTAPDGPVLVIAAAGTGKTRTLTYRVAYLVEKGINPNRILLLTFTNRAAREMLDRARQLVGEAVGGLWGGTFHHMANRLLRRHAEALGYKHDYTILDQDDSRTLVRACASELDLLGKHFPKPDVLLSVFGYAASTERGIDDIAEERFGRSEINIDDVANVHRAYRDKKLQLQAMDFDDLLVNGTRLFREHADLLERYQQHFLYILVDEYQDTNVIQAEWVDRLAGGHRNLLVVGDDFQSIYSWRGANYRNILSFPDRYPGTEVFKLETNYRSVPQILEVANACIAGNPEQFQKTLRAVREDYEKPCLVRLRDGLEQAQFVISEIRRLRAEGYRKDDICVLYRSHYHAMELQLELSREQIPYVITSGVRFFEQAHIKDVTSILRMLTNPGDELAFLRFVEMLPKVGKKTSARIWSKIGQRFDPRDPAIVSSVRNVLPSGAVNGWDEMAPLFKELQDGEASDHPGDAVARYLEVFYDEYAIETFENYDRRIEDIQELIAFTTRYDTIDAFLDEVALLTNLDAEVDADDEHSDVIRLSTVHQAKGLEWKVVFVLWLADGMFPSGRSINEREGESEERRLFYVATTRAKDELYLCVPISRRARDGGTQYFTASRFITEIPAVLIREQVAGYV